MISHWPNKQEFLLPGTFQLWLWIPNLLLVVNLGLHVMLMLIELEKEQHVSWNMST